MNQHRAAYEASRAATEVADHAMPRRRLGALKVSALGLGGMGMVTIAVPFPSERG